MSRNSRNPISWVPTVYFAMGLPFVVLNMVSVLMFKGLGIDDAQIALWTSLIMLPWTLKFLWSPFLEMFKTKKFFVVLTQLITGAGFALVALALHLPAFFAVCIALLAIIAFSGATHDVATDGVYMSELNKQDQAKYIGWQGAFYNIAKIVASGGLVWLAGWLLKHYGGVPGAEETVRHEATVQAWMTVMFILAVVMVLLGVYHMRMLPSGGTAATGTTSGKETWNRLVEVIRNFFQKKHIWYYITFIILYRLAEGFVMKIVPLFLKAERSVGGLGLGEQEIGLYYGTYGAAAFVLGSLLAGYYISHRGLSRTLFSLCCIFNLPFLAYTLLAIYQPENGMLIGGAIVLEYFGYGFGFVGLSLFMMQQVFTVFLIQKLMSVILVQFDGNIFHTSLLQRITCLPDTLTVISHRVLGTGYHKDWQVLRYLLQILLLLQSADQFKQRLEPVHSEGKSTQPIRYIAVHILRIPAQPVTGCPRSIDPLVIAAESSLVNKTADML